MKLWTVIYGGRPIIVSKRMHFVGVPLGGDWPEPCSSHMADGWRHSTPANHVTCPAMVRRYGRQKKKKNDWPEQARRAAAAAAAAAAATADLYMYIYYVNRCSWSRFSCSGASGESFVYECQAIVAGASIDRSPVFIYFFLNFKL